jgi:hypothetical protein
MALISSPERVLPYIAAKLTVVVSSLVVSKISSRYSIAKSKVVVVSSPSDIKSFI